MYSKCIALNTGSFLIYNTDNEEKLMFSTACMHNIDPIVYACDIHNQMSHKVTSPSTHWSLENMLAMCILFHIQILTNLLFNIATNSALRVTGKDRVYYGALEGEETDQL